MKTYTVAEVQRLLPYLDKTERDELFRILSLDKKRWRPLPGPQTDACESAADITGYGGAAGGGKGLALDTPLRTPAGWTSMGEVSEGDWLFDERGQPCRVTAASEVSNRACYKLVFDDGSELVADDVHRWVTFDARELARLTRSDPVWREARRDHRPSRGTGKRPDLAAANSVRRTSGPPPFGTMRDTSEIASTVLTASGRKNHAIQTALGLSMPEAVLPVHPYVLGVWLGDGTSATSDVTGVDDELWSLLEACGEKVRHSSKDAQRHLVEGLKPRLRELGVLGNKHVPVGYMNASAEQRLALLQGLMDTDGHAALDGKSEFDNTRKVLADAVFELALSLGLKATMREGVAKLEGRTIGPKWRVAFTTDLPVFRLTRKLARLKPCRRTNRFRYLVSCEPVDSVPTRCIAVDSPSRLYLAGRSLIPTHNTDLACGLSVEEHRKVMILRRIGTELTAIVDRLKELIGEDNGFNGQQGIFRFKRADGEDCQIELGAVPNLGDEKKYQGRPHDLIVFDEAANFLEAQIRFLLGWLRTTTPGQRCRALLTFNPPTSAEGRWIIDFFGPWLDDKHPNPAKPGELRYFATVAGADLEVPDGRPFVITDGEPDYDFDEWDYAPDQIIRPMSRTFIPSRIADNPFLTSTGYMSTLQALPEPLRSQMLNGDFAAGMEDDPYQVIPTEWVDIAMARWTKLNPKPEMMSVGCDVARGGKDKTVISTRHEGWWFDELKVHEGETTPNGPTVAGLVIAATRDSAPQHIDVIGVGASPYDFLREAKQNVLGINVSEKSGATDRSGRLTFFNQRSQYWWQMRELLDPEANNGIAIPPDKRLRADLTAPKWELSGRTIKVESRDDIVTRIGRSPDFASALILAAIDTPKLRNVPGMRNSRARDYDPMARI